jgi:thiol:disulfide interchange protein DsbD
MELSPLTLLTTFIQGVALNGTPCVFPMISVTVALFAKGKKPLDHSFLRALFYVAGIVIMYSSLGLFAALTGGFFGAAIQNPLVLFAIAAVMFFMALSMFGLYELNTPSFILNWVGARRTGFIGLFISGLFVSLFAAPCVGPFIVALLTEVAQSGDPVYGFIRFFALAFGFGLPYLIFGIFPGLLMKLPKSGEWMIWVKHAFGFVLLGFSAFYAVLSVYPEAISYVVPVTLVAGGAYLGFIDQHGNKIVWFSNAKRLAGILALLMGASLLLSKPKPGVLWETYAPEKITAAQKEGRPVVIDFYADWCLPCHELEQYTYTDPEVINALELFVRLKVDATNPDTSEALEPIERFEILGVPTVLFLDEGGKEVPKTRITGFVPAREFLKRLEPVQATLVSPPTQLEESKHDRSI